ncbi:MAG: hypothetical protein NVSMB52_01980 [Chloroflexota bacterium]
MQRNGQFVQLTELLYRVAEQVDGQRDLDQIAEGVSQAIDRAVSADNVRQLVSSKLIPLGLVAKADGSVVEQTAPDGSAATRSPLQINMRVRALSPRFINPFTALLQNLFWPPVLIVTLLIAGAAQFYVFAIHGVAGGMHDVLYHPALMFAVLGMIIVGTIWHEFGHASALRYGGGEVRGMGVGIYLVYPAFYTDVTDNYRLPRWSKVRTDLGGFYFNLIFGAAMVRLYFLTHLSWLLLLVLLIDLEILQQVLPFGRYDGYWTLADITGIPDFFSRIPAFVKSMLPFVKSEDEEFSRYKVWVRVVFALYVIITAPVMVIIFFMMLKSVPRVLGTGWDSGHKQLTAFSAAQAHGDALSMALAIAQLLILALPTLGLIYILFNLVRRGGTALWNYSKPTPARRVKGSLIGLAVVAFLGYLWIPQIPFGTKESGPLYSATAWQPITSQDRGTLGDVGTSLAQVPVPYNPFHPAVGGPNTRAIPPASVKATATAKAAAHHKRKPTPKPGSHPTPKPTVGTQPTSGAAVAPPTALTTPGTAAVVPTAVATLPPAAATPVATSAGGVAPPPVPPTPARAIIPTVPPTAVP